MYASMYVCVCIYIYIAEACSGVFACASSDCASRDPVEQLPPPNAGSLKLHVYDAHKGSCRFCMVCTSA